MTDSRLSRPGSRRSPTQARFPQALASVILISLLASCGPEAVDEDDREFANLTPPPARTNTPVLVGSPVTSSSTEGSPSLATPDPTQLLIPSTTLNSVFFVVDGALLVASDDGALRPVELAGRVEELSVAPAGQSAAVLLRPASAAATLVAAAPGTPPVASAAGATAPDTVPISLAIIGADGTVVRQVDDVSGRLGETAGIRDAVSAAGTIATVALGPTPGDLLVVFADGLLVRLPAEGEASIIRGSGNLADVAQVSWAPNGQGLAIVAAEEPGEPAAVFYTALRADGIDAVRVAPAPGRTTGEVAWLPDGSGILFVDAAGPVEAAALRSGRDLFVTPLRSDRRKLVAAAGVIGPAAGVVLFAAAPGGEAIAYTLHRAEGDEVRFNSLWVGSIDGRSAIRITLPDNVDVLGLGWTATGLMVLAGPIDGGTPSALLVGPDGVARRAAAQSPATPAP